jgi:prepilin-type N-terminal cleavage/methylation domain-containing protein
MSRASANSSRGFTLIELLVSLALGMLVIGTAVQLFSNGMNATFVVSQRAEMQQNLRATSNLLTKDISLAGAGLPSGTGMALATGTPLRPIYGWAPSCVAKNNCAPGNGIAYPCSSLVGLCIPTLYGLVPGFRLGITPPGSPNPSDVITIVYTDTAFALNCYQVTSMSATTVTLKVPAPLPPTCVLPPPLVAPQAVTDPVIGLTPGDVVLFQGTVGGNTATAIAEVTTAAANGGGVYTVTFLNGDPLSLNQSAAASGDLAQMAVVPPALPPPTTTATRIFVTTYYLWMLPDPLGVGPGVPTLMRQVNGHTPIPVAENVVNLQFTYDTYNANGNLLNATGDGGYALGISFNLIRKINITHLTMRSQVAGARTGLMTTNGYQSFDTQTSISARNLSYQNRYNLGP